MAYAIMRSKKLVGMGSVAASLQHCYRERETHNADAIRTPENEHRAAHSTNEAMGKLREMLPEKRRKDAVLAVEYVLTASPDWWKQATKTQQKQFFDNAQHWLAHKYGADRLIVATVHQDEMSPHLSAFVVPLTPDGRLSAKQFIGDRRQMTADQTSYAKCMAGLGLDRGIEGSRAQHQTIKDFYAQIQQPTKHMEIDAEATEPQVLKKGFFTNTYEGSPLVAERLTKTVQHAYTPAVEAAKLAASEHRRAIEMAKTAQALAKEKKALQQELDGLRKHLSPLLQLATLAKQEFVDLVQHAQERVKAIKAEKEKMQERLKTDQERKRRVDDLVRVERKTVGASRTLARHALTAIEQVGGKSELVEWEQVERAATLQALKEQRQSASDVLSAVIQYSPGMVEPEHQEKARQLVSKLTGKEVALPAPARQRGPRLGR